MSNYERSTTAMTLGTLPETIRTAIREKAEALHLTAMVIGAKDVLVARHGEQSGTPVLAARLEAALRRAKA